MEKVIDLNKLKNKQRENNFEKKCIAINGEKIEMESFIVHGKTITEEGTIFRDAFAENCSPDEQTAYAYKLKLCVDAEILEQPTPKSIKVIKANAEENTINPITIYQEDEKFLFKSFVLFGKVAKEDKEILISYNCTLNERIVFSNNLKTMLDHQLVKEIEKNSLEEIEKLINDIISIRLGQDLPY